MDIRGIKKMRKRKRGSLFLEQNGNGKSLQQWNAIGGERLNFIGDEIPQAVPDNITKMVFIF